MEAWTIDCAKCRIKSVDNYCNVCVKCLISLYDVSECESSLQLWNIRKGLCVITSCSLCMSIGVPGFLRIGFCDECNAEPPLGKVAQECKYIPGCTVCLSDVNLSSITSCFECLDQKVEHWMPHQVDGIKHRFQRMIGCKFCLLHNQNPYKHHIGFRNINVCQDCLK